MDLSNIDVSGIMEMVIEYAMNFLHFIKDISITLFPSNPEFGYLGVALVVVYLLQHRIYSMMYMALIVLAVFLLLTYI